MSTLTSRPTHAAAHDPWLSVVMPAYNGARFLGDALDSVARELNDGVELIAVDDGSTDSTADILAAAARTMPLRVVAGAGRAGWVASTNVGLRLASGAWVCMLHQDDVWWPGRLRSLRDATASSPEAGLVVGATEFLDAAGRPIGRWRLPWRGQAPASTEVARRLYVQNWLAVPSVAVRTSLLRAVGELDEDLWYTADWDLWLRLVREAPVAVAAGILSGFRIHRWSQTFERSKEIVDFESQMRAVQLRHLWAAEGQASVIAAGDMSTRMNAGLATLVHHHRFPTAAVARQALQLGGSGWVRFLRDSRLFDRAIPRVRLALRSVREGRRRGQDGRR